MLSTTVQLQFSEYEGLYERLISKSHILRQINDLVDFGFVFDELRDKYCPDNGRNAEDPIRMFKYLLLKCMYRMSDNDLVERSMYDMSFKYFLNYRPEDDVISPSLLTKFRKLRLVDEEIMDKLIGKSVEIAIKHGIIKSKTLIVDSTHSASRFYNRRPHEVLQEQAKKLRKEVYQIDETMREKFPAKIQGDNIEEHIEYCEKLLSVIESDESMMLYEKVKLTSNFLREIVADNLEHIYTSVDKDAKVGHKSADTSFFGYKTHIAMTEERIVTAAIVTSGEKHDGKQLAGLVEKSRSAGMEIEAVVGDGAYSEKDNIEYAKDNFELVSKLSSAVVNGFRSKEEEFEFNKDAGMFVCKAGHMAVSKTKRHNKESKRKGNPRLVYYFDIEKCKRCSMREGCYKDGNKTKSYSVSLTSDIQKEHKEFQETARFKELSSHRYKIEAKNGELKNRLGYAKAYSTGIQGMQIQGATTLFAANLKRIIRLMNEKE
jgi:transposase